MPGSYFGLLIYCEQRMVLLVVGDWPEKENLFILIFAFYYYSSYFALVYSLGFTLSKPLRFAEYRFFFILLGDCDCECDCDV